MRLADIEWDFIRRHTLIPALTAAIAVVALGIAITVNATQRTLHDQLTANQSDMQQDYAALVDRRRIVDRYHRRYQQFSELGFVGMESRLEWIATLRDSSMQLTLPRVAYIIEPQLTAVAPVESIRAGDGVRIHVSRLELEMNLVHELDLLRFVDELQQRAPGLIKVDRCDMDWQGERQQSPAAVANILASCSVSIYSVITADVDREASS